MSSRGNFKYFGILLCFINLCLSQPADERPNILLIITDQQTATAMSNTGNPNVNTPAMDEIAANGVRFTKAYSVQPLCTPFRTSLQTGKYPHETGVVGNKVKQGNPDYSQLLGKAMTDAGYDVAYHGKWHVGYNLSTNYETYTDNHDDAKVTLEATDFLKKDRTKPFFLTLSYLNPHDACELARSLGGVSNKSLPQGPIPPYPAEENLPALPENFTSDESEPAILTEVLNANRNNLYPTQGWDKFTWRKYLWGYYRLVEKVDAEILKVINALKSTGHDKNTVVIFISDHGDGVAAHHWNQKSVLYNEASNIPLLISYKGKSPAGIVDSTHIISPALDIFPTLLDLANQPIPGHFDGKSLKPFIMGAQVKNWREYAVLETVFDNYLSVSGRALITNQYKYITYNKNSQPVGEQFFDVVEDVGEMLNLVSSKDYVKEVNRYKTMLKDWQKKTGDAEFTVPDTQYVDPTGIRKGISESGQNYPFILKGNKTHWVFNLPAQQITEIQLLSLTGKVMHILPVTENQIALSDWVSLRRGTYIARFKSAQNHWDKIFVNGAI